MYGASDVRNIEIQVSEYSSFVVMVANEKAENV
jgi:hypothetical protein